MESKHTPGPWAWFGDAKFGGFYLATIVFTEANLATGQPMPKRSVLFAN